MIEAPKTSLRKFNDIVEGSPEEVSSLAAASQAHASGSSRRPAPAKLPTCDQYTVNLTENARKGKIDTVLGRDFEIRQIVDILMRRRQNNPILTGEAGVGKTAVVEGFALRVVARRCSSATAKCRSSHPRHGSSASRRGHQR